MTDIDGKALTSRPTPPEASYLQLGVQVGIRRHHVLILLLARGLDEDLLGLPELLLHAGHHRAVLPQQGPPSAQHVPSKPETQLLSYISDNHVLWYTSVQQQLLHNNTKQEAAASGSGIR